MSSLLVFIGENVKFDKDEFAKAVSGIENVFDVKSRGGIGSVFEFCYGDSRESVIVRLSDSLETVVIESDSDLALKCLLDLKEACSQPLQVIDMDYSFHLGLNDVNSLDELRSRIK